MAIDPREHLIHNDVARRGWHVVRVLAEQDEPAYAYSIGLHGTNRQPELIVFGLPPPTLQAILERLHAEIRKGTRFRDGDRTAAALDGCRCAFRDVPSRFLVTHFTYAVRYYGDDRFSALQCVWPDRSGRFPWEPEFDEALRKKQPVLAESAPGPSPSQSK